MYIQIVSRQNIRHFFSLFLCVSYESKGQGNMLRVETQATGVICHPHLVLVGRVLRLERGKGRGE